MGPQEANTETQVKKLMQAAAKTYKAGRCCHLHGTQPVPSLVKSLVFMAHSHIGNNALAAETSVECALFLMAAIHCVVSARRRMSCMCLLQR